MNLGEKIKILRKRLNLSVDDIAEAIGKNRATIYRYENNEIENVPLTVLRPLAKILKTSPAYLLKGKEYYNVGECIDKELEEQGISYKEFTKKVPVTENDLYLYFTETTPIEESLFVEMCSVLGLTEQDFISKYNVTPEACPDTLELQYNCYKQESNKILENEIDSPQEAIELILKLPVVMNYGNYDIDNMFKEEITELVNDVLLTIKISTERIKNRKK